MLLKIVSLFALVSVALARPAEFGTPYDVTSLIASRQTANETAATESGWTVPSAPAQREIVIDFPIHESCNQSQRMQLQRGLFDMKRMLREAADHILLYGNSSEIFTYYFGTDANPATPLGIFERILGGDKSETLFRCDDPDLNCATQDSWNGHWRGNNATGETVICDLSFHSRLPIEKFCNDGFHLAHDEISIYWATDLFHRTMHLPSLSNDLIVHAADSFVDLVALARNDTTNSVVNQHTLQTFAFEAFVRKYISSEGCVGESDEEHAEEDHDHDHDDDAITTTSSSASASAASATGTPTSTSGSDCHIHADGSLHCD